jgi:hypothetical protein
LLWFVFSFFTFLIFSFISIFIQPMYRVSEYIYDLALMDNVKVNNSDFYPSMIMREVLTWIWKILSLFILLLFVKFTNMSIDMVMKITLILLWIMFAIKPMFVYMREKYEKWV